MASNKVRFLCVCLSPAVDATIEINRWPTDGCVIKNAHDVFRPGGKGLNVARRLAQNGADVACAGILGRDNAQLFERDLANYGIRDLFVRTSGITRVNEMFVAPEGSFKVNRPATSGELTSIDDLNIPYHDFDVIIISGSLPYLWADDTYFKLSAKARDAGLKVVLDASGAALREAIKARPDIIKPNKEECEELLGFSLQTPADFVKANAILKQWCASPLISDGENGCWFDGFFVEAPKVEVFDTTGAGDTLLAEWCYRKFVLCENLTDAAKGAVIAASEVCKRFNTLNG
jgi:1-phosphofructokinase family hexose kinase